MDGIIYLGVSIRLFFVALKVLDSNISKCSGILKKRMATQELKMKQSLALLSNGLV